MRCRVIDDMVAGSDSYDEEREECRRGGDEARCGKMERVVTSHRGG